MPSIRFEGREHVHAHHLSVPHRSLVYDKSRSMGKQDDENLIIHGDNLEALKALLPRYGGRVKCIYIDPPYNTGNDNWVYSDNVNSPTMQRWLKSNSPVDGEDMERHDKWLCMMWPRLQLLKELLSDSGAIFVSIDDNEQHRLRMMMDEIFREENFVTNIIWQKKSGPQNDATHFSDNHDFVIVYVKNKNIWRPRLVPRTAERQSAYTNRDKDPRGSWADSGLDVKTYNKDNDYPITTPSGRVVNPPSSRCWVYDQQKFNELVADNRIWFGKKGNNVPRIKTFLSEVKEGVTPVTVWLNKDVGSSEFATRALKEIGIAFSNPKPHTLLEQILRIGADKNALILDSFAGSGTTAHATLSLNKKDGGNRKFILIECEDYADKKTAERVRRVIRGIPDSKKFKEPLGGSFAYYELGNTIGVEEMLTGDSLPSYPDLAAYLLHTASSITVSKELKKRKNWLFHSTDTTDYYLIYEPDAKFLEGNEAILNETMINKISKKGREATVFAADAYVAQKELSKNASR